MYNSQEWHNSKFIGKINNKFNLNNSNLILKFRECHHINKILTNSIIKSELNVSNIILFLKIQ